MPKTRDTKRNRLRERRAGYAAAARKTARLELRIGREQKAAIQRAADHLGRSLTDFVLDSAYHAAKQTIREHEAIALNRRDSERFAQALINPPEPTEAMREAFRLYRKLVGE
ncbi:MAG: type II toxin-antitoxin system TacA family antitoxin [Rhodospirillales bacterium]